MSTIIVIRPERKERYEVLTDDKKEDIIKVLKEVIKNLK